MSGQPRFTLGYWKIRGLAQTARLMFEFTRTTYSEELYEQGEGPEYSRKMWLDAKQLMKEDNPLINLPYLRDSELVRPLTESKAILQHLARVLDLYGTTEQERCDIDNVVFHVSDVNAAFVRLCYNKSFERGRSAFTASLPSMLQPIETWLAARGGSAWIASEHLSVADLYVYEVLECLFALHPKLRDQVACCAQHRDRVHELPALVAYRGSARCAAVAPYNNKSALFK